jgi:type I restriction enzyme S subunit
LEEIADFQVGFAFKSSKYSSSPNHVKLCRGANILPDLVDWSDCVRLPPDEAGRFSEFALEAGDIVIAMDRPWISSGFKIATLHEADVPSLLVQRVCRLRVRNDNLRVFLYQMLRHPHFASHCKPTETTVPHISPKEIRSYKFALPANADLARFGALVRQADRLAEKCLLQTTTFEYLFASLQHHAFAGTLAPPSAEKTLALLEQTNPATPLAV